MALLMYRDAKKKLSGQAKKMAQFLHDHMESPPACVKKTLECEHVRIHDFIDLVGIFINFTLQALRTAETILLHPRKGARNGSSDNV